MKAIIPYNPKLKKLASELRKNSTLSEIVLWKHLKGKQIDGLDFHRQKPINNFIVDFYCPEYRLALEIDGITHQGKEIYDAKREIILKKMGVTIIHFQPNEIMTNMYGVI